MQMIGRVLNLVGSVSTVVNHYECAEWGGRGLMAKKIKKSLKTCADCIHEFACGMWNIGHIHEMDATNCSNYETVKDSAAYLIGRMDERKEGAGRAT